MAFFQLINTPIELSNLTLYRNTENTVYLTLYEKTTISDPKYLFSFKSANTNGVTKNFICQELQTTAMLLDGAWNKFTITEVDSGSEDLTTGEVHLLPCGQWNYSVYAQSSSSNLDPAAADELLEQGIATVVLSAISREEYTPSNEPIKSYTPGS